MGIPPVLWIVEPSSPILTYAILLLDGGPTEFDLRFVLADLQRKAGGGVPCDVAMQNPEPRIVRPEADCHVPILGQQRHVTARRVVVLEGAVDEIVGMEGSRLLGKKNEVMPVQMHRVGKGEKQASARGNLLRRALASHDDVDPIVFGEVMRDHRCFVGTPRVVADVVDGWVSEVEPHGRVEHIPAREVAVWDCIVPARNFDTYFVVVTCIRMDCVAFCVNLVKRKGRVETNCHSLDDHVRLRPSALPALGFHMARRHILY